MWPLFMFYTWNSDQNGFHCKLWLRWDRERSCNHQNLKQEILPTLKIESSEFLLRALKIYTRHTVSIVETPKTVTPKYGFTPKFRKKIGSLEIGRLGWGVAKVRPSSSSPAFFLVWTRRPSREWGLWPQWIYFTTGVSMTTYFTN